MSDNNRATQAEQLIARMQAARGYIYPEWELAARTDPDFTEAYNRIYELALGEGRHVSAKVREFVAIALLASRGADREGLVAHMRRAIRLGATKEELFEVLEATLVPGGAPTFHRGLNALLESDEPCDIMYRAIVSRRPPLIRLWIRRRRRHGSRIALNFLEQCLHCGLELSVATHKRCMREVVDDNVGVDTVLLDQPCSFGAVDA